MKTLAITKYQCPECKTISEYEEWVDKDRTKIYTLLCNNCKPYSLPCIISKPSWIQESERILNSRTTDDPDIESKATDAYVTMREREMASSYKARKWEESRKEELRRYKPTWVKNGRKTQELKQITKV